MNDDDDVVVSNIVFTVFFVDVFVVVFLELHLTALPGCGSVGGIVTARERGAEPQNTIRKSNRSGTKHSPNILCAHHKHDRTGPY